MNKQDYNKSDDLSGQKMDSFDESTYSQSAGSEESLDMKKEQEYQKSIYLMECIDFMIDYGKKSAAYKQISRQFKCLKGYKEADTYAALCLERAKQSKKILKKSIYKEAMQKKDHAKTSKDYETAAELFRKIPGYRDADAMALECDKISSAAENKIAYRLFIRKAVILISVIVFILGLRTSHAKYYTANAYMYFGSYPSAIEKYKKLGAYKDSKEKLIECRYLYAGGKAAEGNYKAAVKEYASIGDYKDSEEQLAAAQKIIIKESKPGNKIKIGKYDWIILEIYDNQAFLMKSSSISKMPYNLEPGEITWENASLRQWLNSDFLENSFALTEKLNIILTDVENGNNIKYNTEGGSNTKDYIFILSIQEAKDYSHLFPDFKTNTWLRSPGAYPDTAAFLSENGAIMDYGYATDSDEFMIRPAMWYGLD